MDSEQIKAFVRRRKVSIAVIAGGIVLLVAVGIKNKMAGPAGKIAPPKDQWEAETLAQDYITDPADADKRFKGRAVGVKGYIERVGNDDGLPYVALKYTNLPKAVKSGVLCYFSAADQASVDQLKPGKPVKLYGVCEGKAPANAAAPTANMVIVKRCQFY